MNCSLKIKIVIYNIIGYLIQPFILIKLLLRSIKISDYRKRIPERYGFCNGKVKSNGIIIHAVSVGELISIKPVVRILNKRYPFIPLNITTTTPSSSRLVQLLFKNKVCHTYLPYDLTGSIKRFINYLRPRLVIMIETELWPNLIRLLYLRNIPLIIINARLSSKSEKCYRKLGNFTTNMMKQIKFVAVQNNEYANRFINLGLDKSKLNIIGNLKFNISITSKLLKKSFKLREKLTKNRLVWIATSTHEGEEKILLYAHSKLILNFPNLLLILVPRHPERFKIVENIITRSGLKYITRSSRLIPSNKTKVIMCDTIGELMLLYGIADIAFIGGSLMPHGGHNPLEAASYAIPIITGPYNNNFNYIYKKLYCSNGLIIVNNVISLLKVIGFFLKNKNYRLTYGSNALNVLKENRVNLNFLIKKILEYY